MRMRCKNKVVFFLALGLLLASQRAFALGNGEPEDGFPEVGYLGTLDYSIYCSAVLIGQTTVLTAAHCLDPDYLSGYDPLQHGLFFAYSTDGGKTHKTVNAKLNSSEWQDDWIDTIRRQYFDYALFRLQVEIKDVTPPTINSEPLTDDHLGVQGTAVGYGQTNYTDSSTAKVKRSAPAQVNKIIQSTTDVDSDPDVDGQRWSWPYASKGLTSEYASACPGDSGGPVFLRNADGHLYLSGLLNFNVFYPCSKHGVSAGPDLGFAFDWIQANTDDVLDGQALPGLGD